MADNFWKVVSHFDPGDEDEFIALASDYNLTNTSITNNREPIKWYTDLGNVDG